MTKSAKRDLNKSAAAPKETVVLLHGILRSGKSMNLVSYYLKHQGYDVVNITYPATEMTLEELTKDLHKQLQASPEFNKASKVHFVTHSMGGLLTRYYLGKHKPKNMGRVVMMGPPNQGSEFADFMMEHKQLRPVFEKVFGPAGEQLQTKHQHAAEAMKIDYEVGVIAGTWSVNPLAPYVLPGSHDGIVPVKSTKIKGMKDHVIVAATHTMMMYNPRVLRYIKNFLENGRFSTAPKPSAPKP